jgi:hypothetical protein
MSRTSELLEGLGKWDHQEAHRQISMVGDAASVTSSQLLELVDCVPSLVERYPEAYEVTVLKDSYSGHRFESLVWTLGESIRRILKRKKSLRRSTELWTHVESICSNPKFGKGRESFTMLLGQYGGRERVPVLLTLLEDIQVQGHALYALRLLGSTTARAKAEELLDSAKPLVRAEARKYLRKCLK